MTTLTASDAERLSTIWKQKDIPAMLRKGKGHQLMVKIPYTEDNSDWLRNDRRSKPKWNGQYKCWELPQAWFNDLVARILALHGKLYIIQPFREQEICAPACWNAEGHECQCACMGENHGAQSPSGNWFTVSETFATLWHDRKLACRLMITETAKNHHLSLEHT